MKIPYYFIKLTQVICPVFGNVHIFQERFRTFSSLNKQGRKGTECHCWHCSGPAAQQQQGQGNSSSGARARGCTAGVTAGNHGTVFALLIQ